MTPLIELFSISKKYRLDSGAELKVLENINLTINDGDAIALLGPTGSGKTTCLKIMAGLDKPTSGKILSRGKELSGVNQDVAMVFQSFALFPWATVFENIDLALKPLNLDQDEIRKRVKSVIDLVGLEGFEEAYPRELSGGMKQRVGLARALVMERPILFLDEPFGSLDLLTAETLRKEIAEILVGGKTETKSILLVTHNIEEAVIIAKRIFIMGTNPGHIRQEVINELPFPRNENNPQFKRLVSHIHAIITESVIPEIPENILIKIPSMQVLPNVQVSEMIGLLESIEELGGSVDIFALSQSVGKDFGQTLYLVKAAEIIEFVDTPQQTVQLTELGKLFVDGDINTRKEMLHNLFGSLNLVKRVTELLKMSETLRLPVDIIEQKVAEWLPNENPRNILNVLISWGRFSEFFGYSDDTKEIYLDVGQEVG